MTKWMVPLNSAHRICPNRLRRGVLIAGEVPMGGDFKTEKSGTVFLAGDEPVEIWQNGW